MFVTLLSIYNPTITKAGAVAKDGIARKIGDKNRDNPKRIAVVTAVRPVLPPSDTPDALSTNVVVVDVPITAPTVVATASAISDTPISVPIVSNKSTNRNANRMTIKFREKIPLKSSLQKTGDRLGMDNPLLKFGNRL